MLFRCRQVSAAAVDVSAYREVAPATVRAKPVRRNHLFTQLYRGC